MAVNSGTAALHIACPRWASATGIGSDTLHQVVASANCALYCGAQADFVDIGLTGNMCAVELERKLIAAQAEGKLTQSSNTGTLHWPLRHAG